MLGPVFFALPAGFVEKALAQKMLVMSIERFSKAISEKALEDRGRRMRA